MKVKGGIVIDDEQDSSNNDKNKVNELKVGTGDFESILANLKARPISIKSKPIILNKKPDNDRPSTFSSSQYFTINLANYTIAGIDPIENSKENGINFLKSEYSKQDGEAIRGLVELNSELIDEYYKE